MVPAQTGPVPTGKGTCVGLDLLLAAVLRAAVPNPTRYSLEGRLPKPCQIDFTPICTIAYQTTNSLSGNWFHKTNDLVWFETLIILSGCCARPSTGLTSRAHSALFVYFHLPLHLWWGAVILFSYTM